MNKLIIIGNLTQNPESRIFNSENGPRTVCNFSVAVNKTYKNKKITEYFNVSCWNTPAENAMKYLQKGSKVCVTGPVKARAFTNRNGEAQAALEIQAEEIEYLSSGTQEQTGSVTEAAPPQASPDGFMSIPDGLEEELPFK